MIDLVFAYLDPGTGATLMQLALAGTAGIAAAGRLRMNKIKRRMARDAEAARNETGQPVEGRPPAR